MIADLSWPIITNIPKRFCVINKEAIFASSNGLFIKLLYAYHNILSFLFCCVVVFSIYVEIFRNGIERYPKVNS